MRGGYIPNIGSLVYVDSWGYYWSQVSLSSTRAYRLVFDSSEVYPSNNDNRFNAFSLRCVAIGN